MQEFEIPELMGYAEAKYICERLLHEAQRKSHKPIPISHVVQIAGPVLRDNGIWSRHEWLPSMIRN